MSIVEVKEEIQNWPPKDQDHLAAYLTVLRLNRDPDFRKELRELKGDTNPEHWLSLDELKEKLSD